MQKIITLLFVITLINVNVSGAVVEFTKESAGQWKDQATSYLATQVASQKKIDGTAALAVKLQTQLVGAMDSDIATWQSAVKNVLPTNSANLLAQAKHGSELLKTTNLQAVTATANIANELSKSNVIAYNKRATDMTLFTVDINDHTGQWSSLQDSVQKSTANKLVGSTATFATAFGKFKKYLDDQITAQDSSTTLSAFTDATNAVNDQVPLTINCNTVTKDKIDELYKTLNTKTIAHKSVVDLIVNLKYL